MNIVVKSFIDLLGGLDDLFITLLIIVILDLILDLLVVLYNKKYNEIVGVLRKNIFKIIGYLIAVMIVVQLDVFLGNVDIFKDALISFTIANEVLMMLDALNELGVPFPRAIKNLLESIKDSKNDSKL